MARRREAPALPWRFNPSAWRHRLPIAALAFVAFGIATYLALYQWRVVDAVWDPWFGDGSARVLDSEVSERMRRWIGVPDAALGALAYLGDAVFGIAGSTRRWHARPWLVILFGVDVIPLGIVSAVLVALQATAVGSWCFLCLVTAVISLVLVGLAWDEVWSCLAYLRRVSRATGSRAQVWRAFWARPSAAARRVAYPDPDSARLANEAAGADGARRRARLPWARWVEVALGAWLVASLAVVPGTGIVEAVCGAVVAAGAIGAVYGPWPRLHLVELLPAAALLIYGWMLGQGWVLARAGGPPGPASQSAMITALFVATFAIVPNRTITPPRVWAASAGG